MQLQSCIESDAVRDIWNPEKFQHHHQQHHQQQQQQQQQQRCYQQSQQSRVARQTQPAAQHHQQFYCALQYQPLILRAEYQRKPLLSPPSLPSPPPPPPPPVLSAEVPEFFPKSNLPPIAYSLNNDKERKACQIRYFPSLNDRNYQNELFPYNRPQQEAAATIFPNARVSILPATHTEANVFRSPQEWIQRVAPPMQLQLTASSSSPLSICTPLQPIHDAAIVHRPLQMYEKFLPCTQPSSTTPIPVYQRPMELYQQEPLLKRKNQGVDFNNLILLTKNSIKTRRGHSKPAVQQPFLLDSRQSLKTSSHNVQVQWFDRDHCAKKTKEVVTVNTLVSELRSFEEKYEYCRGAGTSWKTAAESSPQAQQRSSETSFRLKDRIFGNESSRCRLKDRFFENESSRYRVSDTEKKDKRTKRPLYRDVLTNASNETVLDNVFEKRYDELEQQAMEQYRNSEESLALKYQELERQAMEQYRNSNVGDEKRSMDQDCLDGQRCPKYGHCSSMKGHSGKKRSCFPQITLLKPKGKSLPNVCHESPCSDSNRQAAIVSKSLSALTDGSSKESKNICKGASGDKIDTSVRTSLKRRLILMSPFERKSEARRIMKATELHGICSFSQTRRNVLDYYRTSEIAQNGSGDENITIIQSPGTKVWLSGFWTA
ncbi:uncharacterized protein [Temnothorax nylanderi]|uniref:uncharacterized protein n=1 Tax=Temnothorax nylanderi TaxID=102681 RepID=UPI003A83D839